MSIIGVVCFAVGSVLRDINPTRSEKVSVTNLFLSKELRPFKAFLVFTDFSLHFLQLPFYVLPNFGL